jgi:hypothetical protein
VTCRCLATADSSVLLVVKPDVKVMTVPPHDMQYPPEQILGYFFLSSHRICSFYQSSSTTNCHTAYKCLIALYTGCELQDKRPRPGVSCRSNSSAPCTQHTCAFNSCMTAWQTPEHNRPRARPHGHQHPVYQSSAPSPTALGLTQSCQCHSVWCGHTNHR